MRFKKNVALISIIALLFLLCSCTEGGKNLEIEISPSSKSLIVLASRIYDESQLLELARFDGSINELNAQYPIECLREDYGIYRVSYLGDESIAVLQFDNNGNRLSGNIYNTLLFKSDFDSLTKDQSLEEVRKIDPNGEYLFLYTGRNDAPKVSSHYTKDGYLITIEYDALNNILSINVELI